MKNKWTPQEIGFLKKHNASMTNRQMGEVLGRGMGVIVHKRLKLGLQKMEMEYWTENQIEWLKRLYTHIGDLELAQIFEEAFPKKKPWTIKHIEKKRNYLGLHRTKEQLKDIRRRNKFCGSWAMGNQRSKATIGIAPIGTVKVWEGREYIRTKKGYETYARWLYEQAYGKIPEGMNVVKADYLKATTIENLELITDAELGLRNRTRFLSYPTDLRQTILTLNSFNKKVKQLSNEK